MKNKSFHFAVGLILSLVASTAGLGQVKANNYIELYTGASWLGGDPTKNDYSNPAAGFAKTPGITFGIHGSYYLNAHFGIGGLFSYTEYGMKSDQLAAGTDAAYGTAYGEAKVTSYQTISFLIGPVYSMKALDWLIIDYRVVAGVSTTTSPQIDYSLLDQNDAGQPVSYNFYQNKSTASALGMQAGVGARIRVYKGIGVSVRADYFYSKPNFSLSYTGVQNYSPAGRYITNYNEPFSGINTSFGITYRLGKN